jgi:hypothetical protein
LPFRDEVVGVFVRFSCAASGQQAGTIESISGFWGCSPTASAHSGRVARRTALAGDARLDGDPLLAVMPIDVEQRPDLVLFGSLSAFI